MTAHWIDIGGSEAQPRWVLRQRVLGSYPVQEARIDHEGACSLYAAITRPLFYIRRMLAHFIFCVHSCCSARIATMRVVRFVCGLPCDRHRLWGQCRQGFQLHPSMGLASLWLPSDTQCREGWPRLPEE